MIPFKYLVVVISLASLLILYILSGLSQPALIPLSQVPLNEGKQVIIKGLVSRHQATSFGSTLLTLRDTDNGSAQTMTVYLEGNTQVDYGDLIQVIGTVQQYNNDWEIAVANTQFITVLEKWGDRVIPLWQLAQNPDRYLDTNVNVTGIIQDLTSTTFTLLDIDGTTSAPVTYPKSLNTMVSNGDQVAVNARFVYTPDTLRYSLTVTDVDHGIILRNPGE